MADKKISQLTAASTPLAGTEVLPIVQSSATVKVSVANLTVGRDITTQILTASYTSGTEGEGVNINNPYVSGGGGGGYGSGANFYSYRSDIAAMVKAAQIQTVGRANWNSAANTSSALAFKVVNANTLTESMRIDYTGDIKFNVGNLIQGTAAKGVNFTANTPAAGMTSQLLNWYEEGTWTPVVTSASGTITSYTATGLYTRVGRIVNATLRIQITNAGTGASAAISTLPYSGKSGWTQSGAGRDDNTGSMLQGRIPAGVEDKIYIFVYNNNSPIATGSDLFFTITYVV